MCAVMAISLTQAQTHQIEIHSNNRVASLLMTSSEYSNWISNDEFNDPAIRKALFKDIYKKFQDEFDFIFLVLNEDTKPANLPYGQLIQVSNSITGLGLNVFDNTADYGSGGKLQAVMHLTKLNYLRSGPSLHELMHNWGNFGIPTEAVSGPGSNLSSFAYIPHWGFTGGSTKGQLGGFQQSSLVDNGSGSYTVDSFGPNANGGNSIPYNEMELYLMGMIPVNQVTNFDVFSDITSLTINTSTFDFEASSRTTYSPASIVSLLGDRAPSSATSQKDFKLLVVVLTDQPLTTAQWDIVDSDAEKFGRKSSDGSSSFNFWEATNGVGSMEIANLQNSIVGVQELFVNANISMYPVPATDMLTIEINDPTIQVTDLNVFNSVGQRISILSSPVNQSTIKLDVSQFPNGLYIFNFTTKEGTIVSRKVLVQ